VAGRRAGHDVRRHADPAAGGAAAFRVAADVPRNDCAAIATPLLTRDYNEKMDLSQRWCTGCLKASTRVGDRYRRRGAGRVSTRPVVSRRRREGRAVRTMAAVMRSHFVPRLRRDPAAPSQNDPLATIRLRASDLFCPPRNDDHEDTA